jgi:hypothetical protein
MRLVRPQTVAFVKSASTLHPAAVAKFEEPVHQRNGDLRRCEVEDGHVGSLYRVQRLGPLAKQLVGDRRACTVKLRFDRCVRELLDDWSLQSGKQVVSASARSERMMIRERFRCRCWSIANMRLKSVSRQRVWTS